MTRFVLATWQGRLMLLLYGAALIGMYFVAFDGSRPTAIGVVFYTGSVVALTAAFVVSAWVRAGQQRPAKTAPLQSETRS